MSIHFGDLHNIVRTYQRVLDLDVPEPTPRSRGASLDPEIRVSISPKARELARTAVAAGNRSQGESRP